eukprot:SAG31_NODE_468_length_15250_cov_5.304138_10_plen_399_part_00
MVLLLDEVGLAEHSPDMPLKVLHGILVDPPVAIVGLSNWVLDPAKMNRAVCLQRPEPSEQDLELTAQRIIGPINVKTDAGAALSRTVSAARRLTEWLGPLAAAYHEVYTGQHGRDFIGMRDYYQLIKLLRLELSSRPGQSLKPRMLLNALGRNFGGNEDLMQKIQQVFMNRCFGSVGFSSAFVPTVQDLIAQNFADAQSRHLMVLTKNGQGLRLLFSLGLLEPARATVLIGSQFADDMTELYLVTQINQVKLAMAEGRTIVLLNHDNIYESLYDVLNQRYVVKIDAKSKKVKRMLRLAIGARSQLCQVAEGFKICVVVEQQHAYDHLDLPLLNRFEKQVLTCETALHTEQQSLASELRSWCTDIMEECAIESFQSTFVSKLHIKSSKFKCTFHYLIVM